MLTNMKNIFIKTKSEIVNCNFNIVNKYNNYLCNELSDTKNLSISLDEFDTIRNKNNIYISDLVICSDFRNSLTEENITIYCNEKTNDIIKEMCNILKKSLENLYILPKNTKIKKAHLLNKDISNNDRYIGIEYNINELSTNFIFNDSILTILTNTITNVIVAALNKIKTDNHLVILSDTKANQIFTEDNFYNVDLMAKLIREYQKESGIMVSLSLAQFIYESNFGKSELIKNTNNCFGMKSYLSGNNWYGQIWNDHEIYEMNSPEFIAENEFSYMVSNFRKYQNIESSIVDHNNYLLNSKKCNKYRFDGINNCSNYIEACNILNEGNYSFPTYGDEIKEVIKKYDLVKYDF